MTDEQLKARKKQQADYHKTPEAKAKAYARSRTPEAIARRATARQRPEAKAAKAEWSRTPECKAQQAAYRKTEEAISKRVSSRSTQKALFNICQQGARQRGITFDITFKDVQNLLHNSGMVCALSGVPLSLEVGDQHKASIDRKDSTCGYTMQNLQVVSQRVNKMKQELSDDTFIQLANLIAKKHPLT